MAESFTLAVEDVLRALKLDRSDMAARHLALQYAEVIDAGGAETLKDFGPKLLTVLETLGATPRARAALSKGGPSGVNFGASTIDDLRARRATRARRAAGMDTAATTADA